MRGQSTGRDAAHPAHNPLKSPSPGRAAHPAHNPLKAPSPGRTCAPVATHSLFLILVLWIANLASALPAVRAAPQTGDPQTYVDPLYHFRLALPIDWFISPTPPNAVLGAAVFFNYNPDLAWQTGRLPPDAVKIQIGLAPIAPSQATADWISHWRASQVADQNALSASQPTAFRLGEFAGARYTLRAPGQPEVIELDARLNATQMAVVGITAAQSSSIDWAIAIVSGINPDTTFQFNTELLHIASEWMAAPLPRAPMQVDAVAACPIGTFPGDEAPDSPIPLAMPFLPGQRWMVGGWGSYYGNNAHCNSNHEYYATDWNRMDAKTDGSAILPAAEGTIVAYREPACPTTSYGCYVQVEHAGGMRTRYAHLKAVYRTEGSVTRDDPIGAAGATGNSTGPHLHLSFQQRTGYFFYSNCYNHGQTCPNGEAPVSPQTAKPSPILTVAGYQALIDGRIYTSPNAAPSLVRLYDTPELTGTLVFSSGTGFSNAPSRNAQSMDIPGVWTAKTWRGDDRQGELRCWSRSVPDLSDYGWANAIDSIEVFDHDTCPPAAPSLRSPITGSVYGQNNPVTLSWQAAGAQHYGDVWGGSAVTQTFGWQTAASTTLTATMPGYTYTWRVKTRNDNGESDWSAARTFRMVPARAYLPLTGRDFSYGTTIFTDHFDTDTLADYVVSGSVSWDGTARNVALGNSPAGSKLYTVLSLDKTFIVAGRLSIPAAGVGPFDSVAVAVSGGQTEYWAALVHGTNISEVNHISIMRNDMWGELYPMPLVPGWYRVAVRVDYASQTIQMKVWPDDGAEPDWQLTRALDMDWTADRVGFRHFGTGTRVDDLTVIELS